MLQQLTINNYALIDHTELNLGRGLSVITGETGAGKSIMLGALGMLLGQRADSQVLLNKEQKCVVEATFNIADYHLQPLFEAADIEYDDITILRREILPAGKTRAFVNDTPASVGFLKEIGTHLIDIHSQHQNMLLSQNSFHLNVVDTVAHIDNEKKEYAEAYAILKKKEKELFELKELNATQSKQLDYDRFILNELEQAKLSNPDELPELEKQQNIQDKAEDIRLALTFASEALTADEVGVLSRLNEIGKSLGTIAQFLPKDEKIDDRIETSRIDLDDISKTLETLAETIEINPEEQQHITSRLNLLNSLTHKHGVESVAELIILRDELHHKVTSIDSFGDRLKELSEQIEQQTDAVRDLAGILTAKRTQSFDAITKHISTLLCEMGMDNARFVITNTTTDFTPNGCDDIRFLFAANKNSEPADIAKVASGGEMSRLMLSIKSLLSHSKSLPTIIFDEIDTGVSGEVADKMGQIMSDMSHKMQVLAISHLPQIAARGDMHYRVYKEDTDSKTVSHIELLDKNQRINEIAKMVSGAKITEAALANAKELLAIYD